eukprot:1161190-Pelagomonas_calceolata.AAC.12
MPSCPLAQHPPPLPSLATTASPPPTASASTLGAVGAAEPYTTTAGAQPWMVGGPAEAQHRP